VKEANSDIKQLRIRKYLMINGPRSRSEIVKDLNIAPSTAYDNLEKLLKRKKVEKFNLRAHKKGRPVVLWRAV
jgi:predicted ArsR family transcriptional regulator